MNLIYQYWDGDVPPGAEVSRKLMQAYAERIGAEYLFEHNPKWTTRHGKDSYFFGHLKLVYDSAFDQYDNILYVDLDIYPVEGLTDNVFDDMRGEIGLCEETWQPQNRLKMNGHHISGEWDEKWTQAVRAKWGVDLPRTANGLPRVFNTGLILYTRAGIEKLRQRLIPVDDYIQYMGSRGFSYFYKSVDQNYLLAMIFVCKLDLCELSTDWNSLVHGYFADGIKRKEKALNDLRTATTKLVHIQLTGADDWAEDVLYRITNLPQAEWNLS